MLGAIGLFGAFNLAFVTTPVELVSSLVSPLSVPLPLPLPLPLPFAFLSLLPPLLLYNTSLTIQILDTGICTQDEMKRITINFQIVEEKSVFVISLSTISISTFILKKTELQSSSLKLT